MITGVSNVLFYIKKEINFYFEILPNCEDDSWKSLLFEQMIKFHIWMPEEFQLILKFQDGANI